MECQLVKSLFDAMEMIQNEQRSARDYGAGGPLYHAEVSLLDVMHRYPEKSAAALADMLGITRGALTQTAKKLVEKGLVEQYNPPGNRKTKYHRLTPAGETAREGHVRFHAEANQRMSSYLCGLPQQEKQVLMEFFRVLGSCGQICLYDCAAGCGCGAAPSAYIDQQGESNHAGA